MNGFGNTTRAKSMSTESDKKEWKCVAITLDPEEKRFKTFLENNKHLKIEIFKGIIGKNLPRETTINQGLVTQELAMSPLLTNGAIGCAASHKFIWDKAAEGDKGYLILEDDCYTHPGIGDFIKKNQARLMNVDICFFGINTDSVLHSISPTGLVTLSIFDPRHPSQEWIKNALTKTSTNQVEIHRLIKAFGTCAYFISPNGAKKLSAKLFPLSLATTKIPLVTERMPAVSIDRAGCREYSKLKAFICQPFLAYTSNTDSSTAE